MKDLMTYETKQIEICDVDYMGQYQLCHLLNRFAEIATINAVSYTHLSSKHEEIAEAIFKEIDRGCTFVNVTTGYFHQQQKAVLCVLNNREYAKINAVVMEIDPTAFIIGSEIHSVKGRGFTLPNVDLDKQMRDHL